MLIVQSNRVADPVYLGFRNELRAYKKTTE